MKTYKVEIKLTEGQIKIVENTSNVCRFLYNEMIATNQLIYDMSRLIGSEKYFMNSKKFDKYVNNVLSNYSTMTWIKTANSKSRKQTMVYCERAFKRFFKKQGGFPKFKKKKEFCSVYLPKNNKKDFEIKRHKAKIPILSWIRLKEKGYIPKNTEITSCTITKTANRYYASFLTKDTIKVIDCNKTNGIGVDLGIKELAVCSNGKFYKNINKSNKVKKLEKKLKRKQRSLSRKFESLKLRKEKATRKNIDKNILSIQKIHNRLSNIRTEYTKNVVNEMVRTKPKYITIEDLNISAMKKNKHLSKSISEQKWYFFKIFLIQQCIKYGIEVRLANRKFPSSKTCSCCEKIKQDLKLSERTYKCECGLIIDRDLNASINLKNCKKYKILT